LEVVAGPEGPATPVVGSSLLGIVIVLGRLLVDEVEAVLEAGCRQWLDHHFATCTGVLTGSSDNGVLEAIRGG